MIAITDSSALGVDVFMLDTILTVPYIDGGATYSFSFEAIADSINTGDTSGFDNCIYLADYSATGHLSETPLVWTADDSFEWIDVQNEPLLEVDSLWASRKWLGGPETTYVFVKLIATDGDYSTADSIASINYPAQIFLTIDEDTVRNVGGWQINDTSITLTPGDTTTLEFKLTPEMYCHPEGFADLNLRINFKDKNKQ